MIIGGKELTAEQEQRYNEIWAQWMAEVEQIPPLEERIPVKGIALLLNDREANRPFKLLARKYQPMLRAVIDDGEGIAGRARNDDVGGIAGRD